MRNEGEGIRTPPGIIEKSRVSRRECGKPGRVSLVPNISAALREHWKDTILAPD